VRLAPPLTISGAESDWLLERLLDTLAAHEPLRLATAAPQASSFAA
jgi:hypothetical protein